MVRDSVHLLGTVGQGRQMSFSGIFGLRPSKPQPASLRFDAAPAFQYAPGVVMVDLPPSVVLRCAYCGGVPSGAWRSCDYCGAPVRRGQRINVTTLGYTKPRYIEVEA